MSSGKVWFMFFNVTVTLLTGSNHAGDVNRSTGRVRPDRRCTGGRDDDRRRVRERRCGVHSRSEHERLGHRPEVGHAILQVPGSGDGATTDTRGGKAEVSGSGRARAGWSQNAVALRTAGRCDAAAGHCRVATRLVVAPCRCYAVPG